MKYVLKLLASFLALTLHVHADDTAAAKLIGEMHGVYKYRFMSGDVSGTQRWQAENIVEIVPFDDSHIYFRTYVEGVNGHNCHIYGIAAYEGGAFFYRDPEFSEIWNQRCTLKISLTKTHLKLSDISDPGGEATCPMYCGARVRLSGFSIARGSKRTIRYLDIVKASRQYAEAAEAFAESAKKK